MGTIKEQLEVIVKEFNDPDHNTNKLLAKIQMLHAEIEDAEIEPDVLEVLTTSDMRKSALYGLITLMVTALRS